MVRVMPLSLCLRVLTLGVVLNAFGFESQARDRPQAAQALIVSPDATAPAPTQRLVVRARTFVPFHSTLIGQGGVTRLNFSGALSIHNTSASNVLAIDQIEYRNGSGELIDSYVSDPIYLKPYASLQVIIAQDDVRGGTGASFTIDWSAVESSDEPMIEAIMASFTGPHSFTLLSTGRRVSRPQ